MITAAPIPGGFFAAGPASSGPPTPPPPTPTQLAAPSLAAGVPTDALTTRSVPLTVAGPASWPAGVLVQLQTRRSPGAWTNAGVPIASATTLVLGREASGYTIEIRGIGVNGGALTDSDPSGVVALTVPAAAGVSPLTDATPLTCTVQLFPGSPEAVTAAAGGARGTLVGRADSDNVLLITDVRRAIEGDTVTPDEVALQLEGPDGILLTQTITGVGGTWRTGIAREAFDPARGTLILRLLLTAADDSRTTIEFAVPQGVRA